MDKFKRFLSYYEPHKKILFFDLFCALIAAGISLLYPQLVRYVTNTATTTGVDMTMISKISLVFVFLAGIEYFCNYYISYIGHVMGVKMEFFMRKDLFDHLQRLSLSFYDNSQVGQLMSRITNDLHDIAEVAHHGPEDIIISFVKIVGSFIILLNVNVPLTMIIFVILPFMGIFTYRYNKKMRDAFSRNRKSIAVINAQIEDSLSGIRAVKSFANEDVELKKFDVGNEGYLASRDNSYQAMGRFHSGLGFFITIINIAVIFFGALFITRGVINVTDLVTYLLYINLLIEPIRKLINFTEQFQNGATGFVRFLEILDIEPDIKDSPNAVPMNDNVRGDIEFKNVSFAYNDEDGKVLDDISFSIGAGEYIALVGPSGVGKTTIGALIPRFYDIDEGQILIDGVDIRDLEIKSLREHIGIVQQDIYLFVGSIRDNIEYGKPGASFEEIVAAAKNANAHDFIMELPNGYDTDIGQRGVKLSGGQKQRISIARVFLKDPEILIFDEATSALDNESEKVVQESLEQLAKNRTTIAIAHRLSTIRNAESILVLSEYGIEERGTHDQLIVSKDGTYARYYALSGAGN